MVDNVERVACVQQHIYFAVLFYELEPCFSGVSLLYPVHSRAGSS